MATKNRAQSLMGAVGDAMTRGFDDLAGSDEAGFMLDLEALAIAKQVREEFEGVDGEDSLAELGASLQKRQLQAILVRPNRSDLPGEYLLVAGERRVRAARLVGLTQLRALLVDMTDEEAAEAQFAENVHRKALTILEEARKLKAEVEELGSVEALIAKHGKSKSWVSKRLGLLDLPQQASRLISERVSADPEVIHQVRAIEKLDPQAAREAVDELKAGRGKVSSRQVVTAARERVEAKKPGAKSPKKAGGASSMIGGEVATARDRSVEDPGPLSTLKESDEDAAKHRGQQAAQEAYDDLVGGFSASELVAAFDKRERADLTAWLTIYFELGRSSKDLARVVLEGFRGGALASEGACALGLVALLQGASGRSKLEILAILEGVRP